jgi:NitT/TauT family transport system ATP-binding protein
LLARSCPASSRPPRPSTQTLDDAPRKGSTLDAIELSHIGKRFTIGARQIVALRDVNLRVPRGQIAAIVGPSGSGKSTLLRLICGLIPPDEGAVRVNGTPVAGVDPRLGLVFQEPRLLPWRSALDNVALPMELAGAGRPDRDAKSRELLQLVGVDRFADAYPSQLSGGMAQRVGVARALSLDPEVLLLDEPFGSLDALTRDRLDTELLRLWEGTGKTMLVVTHSIPEAVFLADRVLVLSDAPGTIVADVPVDLGRPRMSDALDASSATRAAVEIRSALARGAQVEPAA